MEFEDGIKMIDKGFEKRLKQEYWEMWLTAYPNMTEKTYIPFNEFYNQSKIKRTKVQQSTNNHTKKQDTEEILSMVEQIRLAEINSRKERGVSD